MAFWDVSADDRRMVVWWGTPVEARSALARLVRDGTLTDAERDKAPRLLRQLQPSWDEIQPSERVRAIAEKLPDRHDVRALDALQLAAALVWCRQRPNR
jgi:hypothetical protein